MSLNIFMVEDNPGDILLLREILTGQNVAHHIHVEYSGEGAIKFLARIESPSECPDLFVIDVQMPGVGGLAVARRIRNTPACASAPILLLSSFFSPTEETEAKSIPVCSFYIKPGSLDEWFEIGKFVQAVCDKSRDGAELLATSKRG